MTIEVETSRERCFNLSAGGRVDVVRVRWRVKGTRRWASFLLIPDEGQSLDELEQNAEAAAAKVAAGEVR